MAAEFRQYTAFDKETIIKIASKFLPYTFEQGYFGTGKVNNFRIRDSAPLILKAENGNEWPVSELLSKIFFEQYIFFALYLFERDLSKEWEVRLTPLAVLNFHQERADCYAWINTMQKAGKVGTNEIDWFRKRIREIYGIVI